jgi:hypothetical protein
MQHIALFVCGRSNAASIDGTKMQLVISKEQHIA